MHQFLVHFKACAKRACMDQPAIAAWEQAYRQEYATNTTSNGTTAAIDTINHEEYDQLFEESSNSSRVVLIPTETHVDIQQMRELFTHFYFVENSTAPVGVIYDNSDDFSADSVAPGHQIDWNAMEMVPWLYERFRSSPTITEISGEALPTTYHDNEDLLAFARQNHDIRIECFPTSPIGSMPMLFEYLNRITAP